MIIQIEIEQFCKELEDKLPNLDDKKFKYWKDKVTLLNRVSIEFMEYEDLMRKLALQHNEMKAATLKMAVQLRDLKSEVEHLKKNIE